MRRIVEIVPGRCGLDRDPLPLLDDHFHIGRNMQAEKFRCWLYPPGLAGDPRIAHFPQAGQFLPVIEPQDALLPQRRELSRCPLLMEGAEFLDPAQPELRPLQTALQ